MKRVAAIDMGTNSTRLLVADVEVTPSADEREVRVDTVERLMRITRLGEGVDATRRLAPAALDRVAACLRTYREVIDRSGVAEVRAVATSAARDAANRDELQAAVEAALGVPVDVISGEEEAALSFLGATAGLDAPAPYLVVDIGGGSTEFVVGTDTPAGLISIDAGCVRLTEAYLHGDPPTAAELSDRARKHGVAVSTNGKYRVRACTHLDVSAADIDTAVQVIGEVVKAA